MRSTFGLALLVLASIACGSPSPTPTQAPTPTPAPTPALLPLPANLSGIPTEEEFTAEVSPQTPEELTVGEERDYTLGHCGLISPVDIDGSLWDPVGTAAALTEQQEGELINATPVVIVTSDENTMQMRTPAGALITLTRHDGPRRYFLCD
jgi:hypothetical protein